MNMFEQMNQTLQAIWLRLITPQQLHYINGADTLPAPLEPRQEQQALAALAAGDRQARDLLITHNLRLVVYIAKKFETPTAGIEDMISIGTIGLIKAVNTFEPAKNIKLATYASRCIENEILMYLRKSSNRRQDASIDEPLNTDSDGNDLFIPVEDEETLQGVYDVYLEEAGACEDDCDCCDHDCDHRSESKKGDKK